MLEELSWDTACERHALKKKKDDLFVLHESCYYVGWYFCSARVQISLMACKNYGFLSFFSSSCMVCCGSDYACEDSGISRPEALDEVCGGVVLVRIEKQILFKFS